MMRRTAQQYDDLRKAFSNASNSHYQEDFCHYKTMMYKGDIERRVFKFPIGYFDLWVSRRLFGYLVYPRRIVLTGIGVIVLFAVIYWALFSNPTWAYVDPTTPAKGCIGNVYNAFVVSALTFSTVGLFDLKTYGSVLPNLRGTEAFLGALYFSMMTAAMVRYVSRR